jgi:flavodoxin
MRYAVIYDSETGNTEMLAKQIYRVLDSFEKELVNISCQSQIPDADVYFVGFPIHKKNCSLKIMNALEQIESGKLALFATCGIKPTDSYKRKLEDALKVWISDDAEYLGMFLCQGRTKEETKAYFYKTNPEYRDKLEDMFREGESHPDRADMEEAARFAADIAHIAG